MPTHPSRLSRHHLLQEADSSHPQAASLSSPCIICIICRAVTLLDRPRQEADGIQCPAESQVYRSSPSGGRTAPLFPTRSSSASSCCIYSDFMRQFVWRKVLLSQTFWKCPKSLSSPDVETETNSNFFTTVLSQSEGKRPAGNCTPHWPMRTLRSGVRESWKGKVQTALNSQLSWPGT